MRTLIKRLLSPGERLMSRARMSTKLLLLATLLWLPLGTLMMLELHRASDDLLDVRGKIVGANSVKAIIDVVLYTQQHRGLTNALLSGDASVSDRRRAVRQRLTDAMANADASLASIDDNAVYAAWRDAHDRLAELPTQPPANARTTLFDTHTDIVTALRRLAAHVARSTTLILEDDPRTQRLTDLSINHFIEWIEYIGRIRGSGAGLLAADSVSDLEAARIMMLHRLLQNHTNDMSSLIDGDRLATDKQQRDWQSARAAIDHFLDLTETHFGLDGDRSGLSTRFFDRGTRAIRAAVDYQDRALGHLLGAYQDLLVDLTRRRLAIIAVATMIVISSLWIMLCFIRSTTQALLRLCEQMQGMADGCMDIGSPVSGNDEMALLGQQLHSTVRKLARSASEMRKQADAVARTGQHLNENGQRLTERSNDQAQRIELTAIAVQQVSTMADDNAALAHRVDEDINACRRDASSSCGLMNKSVDTLASLKVTSDRMRVIVSAIDSIAFQTNILALNAAVEAARAGEAGKGFAVVAQEVGILARRSKEAANEVRELIIESSDRVGQSVEQVNSANRALESLVRTVDGVSGRIQKIAEDSREQSEALNQIAANTTLLDELTQQNATVFQDLSSESARLMQRSGSLQVAIASISADCANDQSIEPRSRAA